ncbi:helix-turn-helix transcriptional regulator [Bacillus cereus]
MPVYQIDKQRIGNFINKVRGDYSMDEFAKRIGVSKGAINSYEKARMIPSKKVAKKIIELSDEPVMTNDEFLYGSNQQYFSAIFESVPIIAKDIQEKGEIYKALSRALNNKEISYGNEKEIVKYIYEKIAPHLKDDKNFRELWNDYQLEPFKFEIENNEEFRTILLPILDEKLSDFKSFSKYTLLVNTFLDTLLTNEEIKENKGKPSIPIRRKSPVKLENYFTKEHIDTLSEIEKYELETNLEASGASMYKFFDEFKKVYPFSIDMLYKDYLIEEAAIKEYLKETGKNPDDNTTIDEYKKVWWN